MRTHIQSPLAETAAGAIAGEVLRACVHCGMCNATCPTYTLTGDELDGPRGRIYLIKGALEGEPVSDTTRRHLDRCLSCRACETTCPSGVQYHRLLDVGREVVAEKTRRPWNEALLRAAIRALAPRARLLGGLLALGRAFRFALPAALADKVPVASPAGAVPSESHARRMALLPGCVQVAAAPHFNRATRRVFDAVGVGLDETPGVGCCGALHAHLDAPDKARETARRNIDLWSAALDAGGEAVVINASGCAAFVRDYPDLLADDPAYADKARRVAQAVRDPIQILAAAPPVARRAPRAPRIAVHDPCTLRNGPRLDGQVARLLAGLGYDPQPVTEPHMCCGSAGAYSLLQPQIADELRARKLEALSRSGPETIYTANIGCWMHLGAKAQTPVRHWIEAVDEVIG